jgi:hypothetical protein
MDKISLEEFFSSLNNGDLIGFYNPLVPAHSLIKFCTKGEVGHLGVLINISRQKTYLSGTLLHITSNLLNFTSNQPELKMEDFAINLETGLFRLKSKFTRLFYYKNTTPLEEKTNNERFLYYTLALDNFVTEFSY